MVALEAIKGEQTFGGTSCQVGAARDGCADSPSQAPGGGCGSIAHPPAIVILKM